jgi:integrase
LARRLLDLVEDDRWVFSSRTGGHRQPRWYQNLQRDLCALAVQKAFTPHSYRHWRARKWADEGLRLSQIKVRLGHESLRTTELYLRSLGVDVDGLPL